VSAYVCEQAAYTAHIVYLSSVFLPSTTARTKYYHAYQVLPCISTTAMHIRYCHAYQIMLCISGTAVHIKYCHAYQVSPYTSNTAVHIKYVPGMRRPSDGSHQKI